MYLLGLSLALLRGIIMLFLKLSGEIRKVFKSLSPPSLLVE